MKNILTFRKAVFSRETSVDWQKIYTDSLPKVFHYFCYKVGDVQIAEDLTAATFEKAWKTRQNYNLNKGQPYSWIIGIARNVTADHFRKHYQEIHFDEIPGTDSSFSIDEERQNNLDFQSIVKILNQYPKQERELIFLKYGAELNNREIARFTGLSESNVGTILFRVVEKLRKEWEKNDER